MDSLTLQRIICALRVFGCDIYWEIIMEYIILLLIIIIAGLLIIVIEKRNPDSSQMSETGKDGVRRENVKNREPIESRKELFSSKFTTRNRRFYIDVHEGNDGRTFMRISELTKVTPTNEIAYTLILYSNEFEGFRNAFERSYGFVKGMDSI